MNHAITQPNHRTLGPAQEWALDCACERIAPAWPLDDLIAVNPWWSMRDQPFAAVAARLAGLGQVSAYMSGDYYRERWGRDIEPRDLWLAARQLDCSLSERALLESLENESAPPAFALFSALVDRHRDLAHRISWQDEITHQVSQFCADFAQRREAGDEGSLYRQWREAVTHDRGIAILMGAGGLIDVFRHLPREPDRLLAEAVTEFDVTEEHLADYGHALLLNINGWASWAAFQHWQKDGQPTLVRELLAVRMAWELALWRYLHATGRTDAVAVEALADNWRRGLRELPAQLGRQEAALLPRRVWLRADEIAYQRWMARQLRSPVSSAERAPVLQAVFCIDVRSEVYRRALEAQDARIQTFGFAGFFGLPIALEPTGHYRRAQLPGLLQAAITLEQDPPPRARAALQMGNQWRRYGSAAPSAFGFVEASGLMYAFKLIKQQLFPSAPAGVESLSDPASWRLTGAGKVLADEQKAELAARILNALGLTQGFAERVLLVGHGSSSCNNPHAGGLDCGACGGHSGEVNVRVLACLLNDPVVRRHLVEQQIEIPDSTRFVAALHNTTTDQVTCFDAPDKAVDREAQRWLEAASDSARCERGEALGLSAGREAEQTRRRARDWSQVRPEWGLAGNASFIVASRSRTRHLNLAGRSFLHDYCWTDDPDFQTLELILTAPLVVTHWINLQYYASTVDNRHYGSGNKVLHNVVGRHLGVFEGNGGDLRIGLPLQSLHDGERWRHTPLRLSAYIAAPRGAIAEIVARHENLRQLVDNEWLYLFALDDDGRLARLYAGHWLEQEVGDD